MALREKTQHEEFIEEHGGNQVSPDGKRFYFPDGAMYMEDSYSRLIEYHGVPYAEQDRLQARLIYMETLVNQKSAQLAQWRDAQNEQDNSHRASPRNCPPADPANDVVIGELAAALVPLIAQLDQLRAEFAVTPRMQGQQALAARQQASSIEANRRINERNAICAKVLNPAPTVYQHELRKPLTEERSPVQAT